MPLCDGCQAIDLNGVRTHESGCLELEHERRTKNSLFEQSADDLHTLDYARFQSNKGIDIRFECDTCKKMCKASQIAEWDSFRGKNTALCVKCYSIYEEGDPLNY